MTTTPPSPHTSLHLIRNLLAVDPDLLLCSRTAPHIGFASLAQLPPLSHRHFSLPLFPSHTFTVRKRPWSGQHFHSPVTSRATLQLPTLDSRLSTLDYQPLLGCARTRLTRSRSEQSGSQEDAPDPAPPQADQRSWRCRGLNPGPLACKASALPLSYIPTRPTGHQSSPTTLTHLPFTHSLHIPHTPLIPHALLHSTVRSPAHSIPSERCQRKCGEMAGKRGPAPAGI